MMADSHRQNEGTLNFFSRLLIAALASPRILEDNKCSLPAIPSNCISSSDGCDRTILVRTGKSLSRTLSDTPRKVSEVLQVIKTF